MSITQTARVVAPSLLALILPLGGCELLDQLEDSGGMVNFYSAHTPTRAGDEFPPRETDYIELDTDTGWHVIVTAAYVTTTAVELRRCDGDALVADFYWGASSESLVDPDLEALGLGAVRGREGNYCSASVTYGPGEGGEDDVSADTVYLRGAAKKGDQDVPFEIRTRATRTVELDMSALENGGPLRLGHDEYVAKELTFAKTYDRFFDGIDFDQLGDMDVEPIVLDTLEIETSVVSGTEL